MISFEMVRIKGWRSIRTVDPLRPNTISEMSIKLIKGNNLCFGIMEKND